MKSITGSKLMAWVLVISAVSLAGLSIFKDMEGLATTLVVTNIPAAVGLYINKQWTDYKVTKVTQPNTVVENNG